MESTTPLEVVCAIIRLHDRVLATRRDPQRAYPLMWEFPGGKLEEGEPAEAALHRELEEELNLKVDILEKREPVDYTDGEFSVRLLPYLCKPAQDAAPVPAEHVELRWITLAESRQLTWAPADVPLVENLDNLLNSNHE